MPRPVVIALVFCAAFAALSGMDILREPEWVGWTELALDLGEKLILLAAMVAVAWAVLSIRDLAEGQRALRAHLERSAAQGSDWRSARRGEIAAMGQAIAAQFRIWQLTGAETDVAGLLLKGCSMKEIALARDTAEATIRQQAQSVYQKAGLTGRTELSAYFLDSLFAEAEAGSGAGSGRAPIPLRAVDRAGV